MVNKRKITNQQDVLQDIENPSRTRQQLPNWLQKQDLTEADLALYSRIISRQLHGLVRGSRMDFLGSAAHMVLLHPDGTKYNGAALWRKWRITSAYMERGGDRPDSCQQGA